MGDKVKDNVTGFSGIVVAITKWLHGCDRIVVQPTVDKDGKVPDNVSFDAPQIVVMTKRVVVATPALERAFAPGGPRDDKAAVRRKD